MSDNKLPQLDEKPPPPQTSTTTTTTTTSEATLEAAPPEKPVDPPPYSAFSPRRRTFILTIATAAGFFGPVCGAVYLPSLLLFQDIFKSSASVINATVSVYMAIFAVAPILGAAVADYGGRKLVYIVALGTFIVANVLLASIPPNIGALFVLRIFQAFGSCMVTSIGAGTVADITAPAKRASAMAIFLLGPQLGPILGPLIGGQFANHRLWRWVFGFLAVTCFPVLMILTFFVPETLRCLVGNGEVFAKRKTWFVMPKYRQPALVDQKKFPKPPKPTPVRLIKPLYYLPSLIVCINGALLFAGLYAMYVTFPDVWETRYGWSTREVGYAYLAPGVSLLVFSIIVGRLSDRMYARAKARSADGTVQPEHRIQLQVYGFAISAAGKVMWGFFSQYKIHPAAGLVASSLVSIGVCVMFVTTTSYQTQCQPTQAALLVALTGLFRNVAAAIAAAIIHPLIQSMGYGWCFFGLAVVDVLCIPTVLLIMYRGPKWRRELEARNAAAKEKVGGAGGAGGDKVGNGGGGPLNGAAATNGLAAANAAPAAANDGASAGNGSVEKK